MAQSKSRHPGRNAVAMYVICPHKPNTDAEWAEWTATGRYPKLYCRVEFQRELFAVDDLEGMRRWCETPVPEGDTVEDGGGE